MAEAVPNRGTSHITDFFANGDASARPKPVTPPTNSAGKRVFWFGLHFQLNKKTLLSIITVVVVVWFKILLSEFYCVI
jgi:hypothetical protein